MIRVNLDQFKKKRKTGNKQWDTFHTKMYNFRKKRKVQMKSPSFRKKLAKQHKALYAETAKKRARGISNVMS